MTSITIIRCRLRETDTHFIVSRKSHDNPFEIPSYIVTCHAQNTVPLEASHSIRLETSSTALQALLPNLHITFTQKSLFYKKVNVDNSLRSKYIQVRSASICPALAAATVRVQTFTSEAYLH